MSKKNKRSRKNNSLKKNNQPQKLNCGAIDKLLLPLLVTILGGVIVFLITSAIDKKASNSTDSPETVSQFGPFDNSSESPPKNSNEQIIMSKPSYLQHLEAVICGEILYCHYGDYDNDGNCEMFALVGEYVEPLVMEDDDNLCGTLWFINQNGAVEIDPEKKDFWSSPHVYNMNGYCFLVLEKAYVTESESYIWGVKDGRPFQPNLIGYGNGINVNKYDEIEITHSTYDAFLEIFEDGTSIYSGHTWKKYYFYYDGKDFKEYGGILITYEDLLRVNGIDTVLNTIRNDGYDIDSIYYRSNNMVNINLSRSVEDGVEYNNITIRILETTTETVSGNFDETYEEGVYLNAYAPLLATYPDKFPY